MGQVCAASGSRLGGGANARTERIRARVSECLKKIKVDESAKEGDRKVTLESIILRFDKSRGMLKLIKDMFTEIAGAKASLDVDGLTRAMQKISSSMSKDDVKALFEFIDLDESHAIELKEFLVALVIGYVLDKIPVEQNVDASPRISPESQESVISVNELMEKQDELRTMMSMIVNAHLLFDPDATGVILRKNVEVILNFQNASAGGPKKKDGKSNPLLNDARWKEMDWNSDGSIDFAEFCFAFCSWVDLDDDFDE